MLVCLEFSLYYQYQFFRFNFAACNLWNNTVYFVTAFVSRLQESPGSEFLISKVGLETSGEMILVAHHTD